MSTNPTVHWMLHAKAVQHPVTSTLYLIKLISMFIAIFFALLPDRVLAESTICKISEHTIGATALAWDTNTKIAKFTDFMGSHEGTIILTRPHNDGRKINLHFNLGKDHYGVDSVDFIVFPINKKNFRIIGAAYKTIDGHKYLTQSYGEHDATCISL